MKRILPQKADFASVWMSPLKGNNYDEMEYVEIYSMTEEDVESFLLFFLRKYFNEDVTMPYRKNDWHHEFEWWAEANVYTYENMKDMLEELKITVELLRNDYKNEKLDNIKKHFVSYAFDEDFFQKNITDMEKFFEQNKNIAILFYLEFIKSVEKLIEKHPECTVFAFEGP